MASEIGATEVSAVQGSLVSQLVQQALREKAVAYSTILDIRMQSGLTSLKIPRVDNFTAAAKSENTDLSNQEMTVSAATISYNKHYGVRATIEDAARLSAGIDVSAEVIKGQADELARQIDADIIHQIKSVSSSTPDHLLDYASYNRQKNQGY